MLLTFIFFGITNTILGSVLPSVLAEFGWTYSQTGFILAAGSVGYFVASFIFGYLVNILGLKTVLVAGLCLVGISNILLGQTGSVMFNILVNTCIGIGNAGLEVVVNTAVVRMERKGESHLMGFAHASYSIGAVVGPLAAAALLAAGAGWKLSFRVMGFLYLASALLPLFLPFNRLKDGTAAPPPPAGDLPPDGRTVPSAEPRFGKGSTSIVLLGALTILLYVGFELGISNWAAEYFVNRFAVAAEAATTVVALFWAGILAGRIGIPLLARKISLTTQLRTLSIVSAVSVVLVILLPGAIPAAAGLFLAGLGCSSIYPLVMSLVGKHLTRNQSVGLGVVATAGGIGSFTFPFVTAGLSQAYGIVTGFIFFAFAGVLLILSILALNSRIGTVSHGES